MIFKFKPNDVVIVTKVEDVRDRYIPRHGLSVGLICKVVREEPYFVNEDIPKMTDRDLITDLEGDNCGYLIRAIHADPLDVEQHLFVIESEIEDYETYTENIYESKDLFDWLSE